MLRRRGSALSGTRSEPSGTGRRILARLDAWANALYGWRGNPLYHSGAIAIVMLIVLLVTGLYLIFFYRLGAPHASMVRIQEQVWAGRWLRALHRYAADVALLAAGVHALRLWLQRRTWGPRTLAWLSGLFLVGLILVCGWTGYVMVWDTQGHLVALAGARLMDVLPLFSEPLARSFSGELPVPTAFFFLNLFAHVALPIGLLLVLWLHVSRLARPALFPPRRLGWGLVGLLTVLSIVWSATLGPQADPLRVPADVPLDVFYNVWMPWTLDAHPGFVWGITLLLCAAAAAVPWWTRPRAGQRPAASVVDTRRCTGCEQCYLDCPYEAIAMVDRPDGRAGLVAHVDPALCVSCGICAASCAPMGVGPPGRTGRDQLEAVEAFIAATPDLPSRIVIAGCRWSAAGEARDGTLHGEPVFPVGCAGNLHTSVIEYLVRAGAAGVLVASCPPRDCWSREGPKWLEQRIWFDREAELKARVDRGRVRVVHAARAEHGVLADALATFRADLARAEPAPVETDIDLIAACETEDAQEVGA